MYYKIIFERMRDEDLPLRQSEINRLTGKESIEFDDYSFELIRDAEEYLIGFEYCSECVRTFDIERSLLKIALIVSKNVSAVTIFDSDGGSEIFDADELESYLDN